MRATIKPQNLEEQVLWHSLVWTYPIYLLGILPIVPVLVVWGLSAYAAFKLWSQQEDTPASERAHIPVGCWVWLLSMLLLEVALIMGHVDQGISNRIVRSTVNVFLKNWYLFALLPFIGSCLAIRPRLVARAVCLVAIQSLILGVITHVAATNGNQLFMYKPPLGFLVPGGVEGVFFAIVDDANVMRVNLFAPWPPALGLVGAIFLSVAYREPDNRWRIPALLGAVFMIWSSGSRTGQICLYGVPTLTLLLTLVSRPIVQIAAGITSFLAGIYGPQIYQFFRDYVRSVDQQRADSSALRRIIFNISIYRWRTEAFWWGHSKPVLVPITGNKPLGSHNHWAGLLFNFGIVGFAAFAIPVAWTFVECWIKAQHSRDAQVGLAVILSILFYANSENLDVLMYLFYPGLLWFGFAFKERVFAVAEPDSTPSALPQASSVVK